jgi:hypothetical protein
MGNRLQVIGDRKRRQAFSGHCSAVSVTFLRAGKRAGSQAIKLASWFSKNQE